MGLVSTLRLYYFIAMMAEWQFTDFREKSTRPVRYVTGQSTHLSRVETKPDIADYDVVAQNIYFSCDPGRGTAE